MTSFKDLKTGNEIKTYLKKVLSRTGNKGKADTFLYHYTKITSLDRILDSGFIWLGSSRDMNDYMEGEYINSVNEDNRLFFSCFSRAEENLAMYKMYAPSPAGVMMSLSFAQAQSIIDQLQDGSDSAKLVYIVRDNKLTNDKVEADVYWAAVAYKDLHSNLLKVETVVNTKIATPFKNPELAGFVKLYGWEYEKEVRLCAYTRKPLEINEKIAIPLPDSFSNRVNIITCPEFNKQSYKKELSRFKRLDLSVHDSEYDALVNLGYNFESSDSKRIRELEEENIRLKECINKLEINAELNNDNYSISNEALVMLSYAAHGNGKITVDRNMSSNEFYTAGGNYPLNRDNSVRESVLWGAALGELELSALIESVDLLDLIYRITKKGFDLADAFIADNNIDFTKAPSKVLDELNKKR